MKKVQELLERMDAEILEKVNAIAIEKDAEIKAYAQEKYEEAVADKIAQYKLDVEKEYATAKAYLSELVEDEVEPIAEEPIAEAVEPVAEPTPVEAAQPVVTEAPVAHIDVI